TGRMSEFLPGRSPQEYSQTIANDVAATVADKPDIDLDEYLNAKYTGTYRSFVVVTRYGQTIVSQRIPPPPSMTYAATGRMLSEINGSRMTGVAPDGPGANGGSPRPNTSTSPGAASGQDRQADGRPRSGRGGDGWGGRGFGRGRPGPGGGGPGGQ